jgi:hypothetical protein
MERAIRDLEGVHDGGLDHTLPFTLSHRGGNHHTRNLSLCGEAKRYNTILTTSIKQSIVTDL